MNTTTDTTRLAVIRYADERLLARVEQYMPRNYSATLHGDHILVEGHDSCGWTLDDFIIPRLASGSIYADEVLTDGNFISTPDSANVGPCEHCGQDVHYESGKRYGMAYHFACWLAVLS